MKSRELGVRRYKIVMGFVVCMMCMATTSLAQEQANDGETTVEDTAAEDTAAEDTAAEVKASAEADATEAESAAKEESQTPTSDPVKSYEPRSAPAPEPSAEEDSDKSADEGGAFFRLGLGTGFSRDQTLEYQDEYATIEGVYADVELAPGYALDAYNALHLWIHWQYPSINERGNYTPNSGEPLSVVDLGFGYTRNAKDVPVFATFNVGVSLNFVEPVVDGLQADEVGKPGIGAAGELGIGFKLPVGEAKAVSLGAAAVTGVRTTFTSEEVFQGFYVGPRLLMVID